MTPVTLVVEGACDEAVLKSLLDRMGLPRGDVYVMGGKSRLDGRLRAYSAAGKLAPWIVLRDMDSDAGCPPALLAELKVQNTDLFRLHIAVRTTESWLLADRSRFADFLAIPVARIPLSPDQEQDPKQLVVSLARSSRSSKVVADMVPAAGSSARVGRAYTARLIDFAVNHWDALSAESHSPSLASLLAHLRNLGRDS